MNQLINLSELNSHLKTQRFNYVFSMSFEDRSLSLLESIPKSSINSIFPVINSPRANGVDSRIRRFKNMSFKNCQSTTVSIANPIQTADIFSSKIIEPLAKSKLDAIIDITTFTHEQLLIFFRLLKMRSLEKRALFCYVGASSYGHDNTNQDIWLTKGVGRIRTILGYPGIMLPSRDLHLTILVGFENERAQAIIESFEPKVLSLGLGSENQSINSSHYKTNQAFHSKVKRFVKDSSHQFLNINVFKFSCKNPNSVKRTILSHVKNNPGVNHVVCPMNTKLSTLGSGMAAIANPEIQLAYMEALIYNTEHYSTPGQKVSIFRM